MRSILTLLAITQVSFGLAQKAHVSDVYRRADTLEITSFIRQHDPCFDTSWRYDSARSQLIPNHTQGIIFFFHKIRGGTRIHRYYSFNFSRNQVSEIREKRLQVNEDTSEWNVYFDRRGIYLMAAFSEVADSTWGRRTTWQVTYEEHSNCQLKCVSVFRVWWIFPFDYFRGREEFQKWKVSREVGKTLVSSTCK